MARVAKLGLSRHETKGFRISIGRKADGGYRTFWLGHDRAGAEYAAGMYRERFALMRIHGREAWTDADEAAVREFIDIYKFATLRLRHQHQLDVQDVERKGRLIDQVFGNLDPVPTTVIESSGQQSVKLYAAIATYIESFNAKAISAAHKERTRQLLGDLKHFRSDLPLKEIDRVWLQTLTDEVKARPKARKRKTALSPYTVRNMLRSWSRFFDWIDANADSARFGNWQAPRRWEELFEVKMTKLMSKAERDARADGPKQLTVEQVVRLYGAAKNDVHRICVLLGVFAALGQREIASLRRDEFNFETGILTHRRSKTGQLGKFWLPPEAIKLIRTYFRDVKTDSENTAFFTADGERLVTETSDAVRQAWTDIVDRVNKQDGPKIDKGSQGFYHLRKFSADYAMRTGGPVVRDTMLAHAPESVGAKHYSNARNFDDVFATGRKLHAELTGKGMFPAKAVQRQKPLELTAA